MTKTALSKVIVLTGLALVPPIALLLDEPFYLDLFARIMIFAIAAVSLDLILGFGGMVSFGHAVYLGLGAYAVGICSYYGVTNGFAQFAIAVAACALVGLAIGAVSLRTSGVFFIMITLAFSQMIYFLGISVQTFGGSDGLTIERRSQFGRFLDLDNGVAFYYLVAACLVVVLWMTSHFVESRFGMVLRGVKSNERRMAAIGFSTFRYKLAAFVIASVICGLAGALLANQALFVSPAIMHWGRSGEIMAMVIMGGVGSLVGPIVGAVAFLVLEDVLSGWSDYWQLVFGPALVLIVLFGRQGLLGLLTRQKGEA